MCAAWCSTRHRSPDDGTQSRALRIAAVPMMLLAGGIIAVQSQINGRLADELGSGARAGLAAAVVSFGSGLVLLAVVVLTVPSARTGVRRLAGDLRAGRLRPHEVLGGLFGAFLVATQGITVATIGVALFSVAITAGQASSGLIVDHFGIGPSGHQPLSYPRAVAAAFAIAAVVLAAGERLVDTFSVQTAAFALLPLLAGFGTGIQLALNGRLNAIAGPWATTFNNFLVGTVALVVVFALSLPGRRASGRPAAERGGSTPAASWASASSALAALLVKVHGVLVLGLCLIAGQVICAELIELLGPSTARGYRRSRGRSADRRRRPRGPAPAARGNATPRTCRIISYLRYRVGDHVRTRRLPGPDRHAHPRRPPAQRPHAGPARHRAQDEPERRQPHRAGAAEPDARDARAHRQRPRLRAGQRRDVRPQPPAGQGRHHAVRRHRREVQQERRRRPAVRLAAQRGHHRAAQGGAHRGGQPAARGAGVHRRPLPLAQRRQRPRARRAGRARPRVDGRRGRPPHPQHHHVPRPADAPRRPLRAPLRRRLRPRHPHRRAAHDGAAPVRPQGRRHRRQLPRRSGLGRRPGAPDRAHRARRHRHRERPAGGRPVRRRHGHPQRQPQLHGPGPLLLPAGARASRSRASAPRRCASPDAPSSTPTSSTRRARTRSRP